jgi:hypothetical protein
MNSVSLGVIVTGLATAITVTLQDGSSQFTFAGSLDLFQGSGSFNLGSIYATLTSIEVQGSCERAFTLLCPIQTSLDAITFNLMCQDESVTVSYFVGGIPPYYSAPSLSGNGFTATVPVS